MLSAIKPVNVPDQAHLDGKPGLPTNRPGKTRRVILVEIGHLLFSRVDGTPPCQLITMRPGCTSIFITT